MMDLHILLDPVTDVWKCQNKIASQRKTHAPRRFLYLRETKIWWCEEGEGEEGGEEKVSMLTHATARGVGKNGF